jgi:glycine/D-amino acid oxidase-like deaminating enzyme
MSETADILIVGGGVIGVSIAYHLARRGFGRIVLLERDSLACGSTGRSVATIDLLTLQPHAVELYARSAVLFHQCDQILGSGCGFVETGSIILAGPEQESGLSTAVSHMQAAGVDVQSLTLDTLRTLEPQTTLDEVVTATYSPQAGYADPVLTTQALAGAARRIGVDMQQGRAVTRLRRAGKQVIGVETASGNIDALVVIVAAGAWSATLLRTVGIELDLQPVRHQVVCLRRPSDFTSLQHSLLDLTTGIYARPESGGLILLGSINPDVGYDSTAPDDGAGYVHDDYILWAMERLVRRYPALAASELAQGWAGIMTISPDWQPVLGNWPDTPNLYCAAGFSGKGFQMSPATGDLMAGLVSGDAEASNILAPFAPSRFDDSRLLRTGQEGKKYGPLA